MKCNPFSGIQVDWLDFEGVTSESEIDGKRIRLDWEKKEDGFQTLNEQGLFTLKIEKTARGFRFLSKAVLKEAVKSFFFCPLTFPAVEIEHIFTGAAKMGGSRIAKFPLKQSQEFSSFHTTILTKNGKNILFSSPLKQSYLNRLTGTGVGSLLLNLRFRFEAEHCNHTVYNFDPVTVECGSGLEMLIEYGKSNSERRMEFSGKPEYGWNSWDYYRWTINEDEVIKNAEFIAKDPVLSQHIKRIIVDDGWQYCYGEWEANSQFPSGMKKLAERILKLGMKPGLWVAPSIVEPHCIKAQMNYDMMGMSEGGQACLCYHCMQRQGFVLDPTVKASQEFLRQTFDRLAGLGYQYFKLDFLGMTLNAPRFHDESVPRSQILRKLMDAVTAGVAGRASILGCNYHYFNGNSYVDAVRIGGDIHSKWNNIKSNTVSIAGMFWANKRLWLNDPDFALCRGVDTSDDPDLNRLKCCLVYVEPQMEFFPGADMTLALTTFEEQKTLLSLDLMAGGAINLSDNLPRLNVLGVELARKVVSAESGEAALPLDLFDSDLPGYWFQKLSCGHRLLLVNWKDEAQVMKIDWNKVGGKPAEVRDFWSETVEKSADAVEIAPHSCKLLEF